MEHYKVYDYYYDYDYTKKLRNTIQFLTVTKTATCHGTNVAIIGHKLSVHTWRILTSISEAPRGIARGSRSEIKPSYSSGWPCRLAMNCMTGNSISFRYSLLCQ